MRCNDDIDDGQLRKIAKKNESKTVCHEQGIKCKIESNTNTIQQIVTYTRAELRELNS